VKHKQKTEMKTIENIDTIGFSCRKGIAETENGYTVKDVLVFKKEEKQRHSTWLCEAVFRSLGENRMYKKNSTKLLFIGWTENEFSFYGEDLDEALEFLNNVIFA
jgi:hypothetical protein